MSLELSKMNLTLLWSRRVFCCIKAHKSIPADVLFVTNLTKFFNNVSLSNLHECQPKNRFYRFHASIADTQKGYLLEYDSVTRWEWWVSCVGFLSAYTVRCDHKKQWICDCYFDTLRFSPQRQLYSFDQLLPLHSPSSTWLARLLLPLRHEPQRLDRQLVPPWMNTAQTEPSSGRIPPIAIGLSRVSLSYVSYLVPYEHLVVHLHIQYISHIRLSLLSLPLWQILNRNTLPKRGVTTYMYRMVSSTAVSLVINSRQAPDDMRHWQHVFFFLPFRTACPWAHRALMVR